MEWTSDLEKEVKEAVCEYVDLQIRKLKDDAGTEYTAQKWFNEYLQNCEGLITPNKYVLKSEGFDLLKPPPYIIEIQAIKEHYGWHRRLADGTVDWPGRQWRLQDGLEVYTRIIKHLRKHKRYNKNVISDKQYSFPYDYEFIEKLVE